MTVCKNFVAQHRQNNIDLKLCFQLTIHQQIIQNCTFNNERSDFTLSTFNIEREYLFNIKL